MRRNCHNCTCAIAHEHIIGDPDRNGFAGCRIDSSYSLERYACLFLYKLAALKIALSCSLCAVFIDCINILYPVSKLLNNGVFGSYNHVCRTKQGIGASSINPQALVITLNTEYDLRTGASSYPILLRRLNSVNEIDLVKIVNESVRILRYLQHPL